MPADTRMTTRGQAHDDGMRVTEGDRPSGRTGAHEAERFRLFPAPKSEILRVMNDRREVLLGATEHALEVRGNVMLEVEGNPKKWWRCAPRCGGSRGTRR